MLPTAIVIRSIWDIDARFHVEYSCDTDQVEAVSHIRYNEARYYPIEKNTIDLIDSCLAGEFPLLAEWSDNQAKILLRWYFMLFDERDRFKPYRLIWNLANTILYHPDKIPTVLLYQKTIVIK